MDSTRFDSFTRILSVSDSRRGVVRTLSALGAGLGLTQFVPAPIAEAGKKRKRKKKLSKRCKKNKQCKGNLLCKKSNSQNSCFPSNKKRCCVKEGKPCDDSCDCCGIDVICNGGFCQSA